MFTDRLYSGAGLEVEPGRLPNPVSFPCLCISASFHKGLRLRAADGLLHLSGPWTFPLRLRVSLSLSEIPASLP